jgi:hypothetical protein
MVGLSHFLAGRFGQVLFGGAPGILFPFAHNLCSVDVLTCDFVAPIFGTGTFARRGAVEVYPVNLVAPQHWDAIEIASSLNRAPGRNLDSALFFPIHSLNRAYGQSNSFHKSTIQHMFI